MIDSHRRRAAVMLAMMVVGTAAMGLSVWATAPPAASAGAVDTGSPVPTTSVTARDAPSASVARPTTAAATTPTTVAAPTRTAAAAPAPPATAAAAARACTPAPLAQRAARTLIVGLPGVTDATNALVGEILDLGVGGVFLNTDNVKSKSQVIALVKGIRARAGRPVLVSTDEEPGRVSVFRELVGASASARRLAAQETPAGARQQAARVAGELAAMGIDLNLAPVADLDDGPASGIIGDRSFSADPTVAADYAYAYAAGLADGGVLPVVKHFPGQGRSSEDIHFRAASVNVTLDALQDSDLRPFDALIRAGVPAVMMNHLRYSSIDPSLPASLSPRAYELLRGLGFRGAAITDSVGMAAVNQTWDVAEAAVRAVSAGADGVLNTGGQTAKDMRHGLVAAVQVGTLDESRVNEAASRMVALAGGDPRPVTCTTGDWLPDGVFARRTTAAGTPLVPTLPDQQDPLTPVAASRATQGQR